MPKMYALVCFADGDARVYDYDKKSDTIVNLPSNFTKNRDAMLTYVEYGFNKKLLIKMAEMAQSDYWREKEWDIYTNVL